MLSQHSVQRDHHGIPIVSRRTRVGFCDDTFEEQVENESWNSNHKKLQRLTTKILDLLGQIAFMERWFLPYLQTSHDPVALALGGKSNNQISDRSVAEELVMLENVLDSNRQRWRQIVKIMSASMAYTMRWGDDTFHAVDSEEACRRPSTLFRVWTPESYSPYSEDLGFRCSDWASCKRYVSLEDLRDRKFLTTESLQNHCEKKPRPSVWISFSDDASWTLSYAEKWGLMRNPTCRVAIISVERLERCNIPWGRSHNLVELTGGKTWRPNHPDGVRYAFPRQILVYGCVPAQCLVGIFSIQRFREFYREQSLEGNSFAKSPYKLVQPPRAVRQEDIDTLSAAVNNIQV